MHWPAEPSGTLKMEKGRPVRPAEDSRTLKLEKVCLSIPQRPAEHRKTLKFEKIRLSNLRWLTKTAERSSWKRFVFPFHDGLLKTAER